MIEMTSNKNIMEVRNHIKSILMTIKMIKFKSKKFLLEALLSSSVLTLDLALIFKHPQFCQI